MASAVGAQQVPDRENLRLTLVDDSGRIEL